MIMETIDSMNHGKPCMHMVFLFDFTCSIFAEENGLVFNCRKNICTFLRIDVRYW